MVKSILDNLFRKPAHIAGIQASLARGELDAALERANQLLEMAPNDGVAYRLRAQVHYARQAYEAALDDLDQAVSHDDSDENRALCHTLRGMIRLQRQEPQMALAEFGKAISASALYSQEAFVQRGKLYMQMGDTSRAIEDFSTALRFEINTSLQRKGELRRLRGDLYRDTGNPDAALEDYLKARYYNPRDAHANAQAAELYINRGDWRAAYTLLEEVSRTDPANADKYRPLLERAADQLGILLPDARRPGAPAGNEEGGRRAHPLAGIPSLAPREPHDTPATAPADSAVNRALEQAMGGNLGGALATIDDALRQHPDHPQALVLRGNICYALGRYDGALASFRRVQTSRDDEAVNAGIAGEALTHYALGDEDEARALWGRLVERDAAFADVTQAQARLKWADQNMDIVRQLLA